MDAKRRVVATSTHFAVQDAVKVPDSASSVENNQEGQLLIDPEDQESGSTHVAAKKLKASDPVVDKELKGPVVTHDGNESDPAQGYLHADQEDLPVEDVPDVDDAGDDDLMEDDSEADGTEVESDDSSEFDGLDDLDGLGVDADVDDIDDGETGEDVTDEMVDDAAEAEDFETEDSAEAVALVDADEIPDEMGDDSDDLQFASIDAAVHVIRSNRIIASMGLVTAKRVGVDDVYQTEQFQDVVVANVASKGLRKGLVQSGFVLAKVKLTANKGVQKLVKSRVEAGLAQKVTAMEKQRQAMEQSLAIAAVGINRRFFKDVNNELKANLEAELVHAGVRGGQNIVRAMFAKYGVSYAKSLLTLATRISAMPEEMRDQYAEALDLTNDEVSEEINCDVDDLDTEVEDGDEESFDPIPATVQAALRSPVRRDVGVLLKSSTAMSILNGSQSLV